MVGSNTDANTLGMVDDTWGGGASMMDCAQKERKAARLGSERMGAVGGREGHVKVAQSLRSFIGHFTLLVNLP